MTIATENLDEPPATTSNDPAHSPVAAMIVAANKDATSDTRPTCAPANAWTDDAFQRLYSDVCRDIADLSVKTTVQRCVPHARELAVMAEIPARLTMALSRLMTEAIPALRNAITTPEVAQLLIDAIQNRTNADAVTQLHAAQEAMQSQWEQINELQQWGAQDGVLIRCCTAVAEAMDRIALITAVCAPSANPRAMAAARETVMHLSNMKARISIES